ncbi:hypothetical protein EGW08_009355, partial [Elysia chlorotica]
MTTAPGTQYTNGQYTYTTLSSAGYSGSGKFLPSIARRAGYAGESPNLASHQGVSDSDKLFHGRQHSSFHNRVNFSPVDDMQHQEGSTNHNPRHKVTVEVADGEMAAVLKSRRWIFHRSSDEVKNSSPNSHDQHADITSPLLQRTWQSNPSRIHIHPEDSMTRKLDRKAIARRHLVCGLAGGHHSLDKGATQAGVGGREDARRAHSFNCHAGELNQSTTADAKQNISTSSRNLLKGRSVVRRSSATERAREALDNWNSLVHQLQAEHHQGQLGHGSAHLAVLSDADADSSPGSHKEPCEHDDQLTPGRSHRKITRTTSLTFPDMKFPVGIGFTRYRPLTPNLLTRLDKQKMPVKRRTQLWVNSIQESKRTLPKASVTESPIEGEAGHSESCAIRKNHERGTRDADRTDMMVAK